MPEAANKVDMELLKDVSILYVEDDLFLRERVLEFLKMHFRCVYAAENGKEGLEIFGKESPDVVVTDIKMPVMNGLDMAQRIKEINNEIPIIILTAFSEASFLMKAIEIGVDRYVQKPTEGEELIEAIYKSILPGFQKKQIDGLTRHLHTSLENLLGKSATVQNLIEQVRQVAWSNFSVIIQGETGVGKSLIASTIHSLSKRADKPFIIVDIGVIPETLVESELFGYKKGAFTGADKNKTGFFERASGGTILLDELENMTPYVQSKLLRAVEDKKIYPLGSTSAVDIDIRIIGATNTDLAQEVREKKFREDLYYRLCEFNLYIPPLRERKEDIPLLARKFLAEAADELDVPLKPVEEEAMNLLAQHHWHGNVRELKNVMRRIALLCKHKLVTVQDVEHIINPGNAPDSLHMLENTGPGDIPCYPLSEVEKWAITKVLEITKGKKLKAASLLKVDYKTLNAKIKKYKIN